MACLGCGKDAEDEETLTTQPAETPAAEPPSPRVPFLRIFSSVFSWKPPEFEHGQLQSAPRLISELSGLPREVGYEEQKKHMTAFLAAKFGLRRRDRKAGPEFNPETSRHLGEHFSGVDPGDGEETASIDDEGLQVDPSMRESLPTFVEAAAHAIAEPQDVDNIDVFSEGDDESSTDEAPSTDEADYIQIDTLQDARTALRNNMTRYTTDFEDQQNGRQFIPDKEVWCIMTAENVAKLLQHCGPSPADSAAPPADGYLEAFARKICPTPQSRDDTQFVSYRKVFCVLILIGRHSAIFDFVNGGLHDGLLPFPNLRQWIIEKSTTVARQSLSARNSSNDCHPCLKNWETQLVNLFEQTQWEFCSPFLQSDANGKCLHYTFQAGTVLPFENITKVEDGGYATVYKADINIYHRSLDIHTGKRENQLFAVKRLHQSDRLAFQDEADILGKLNTIAQKSNKNTNHLAKLTLTFELESPSNPKEPVFFFVFPCADMSLKQFWDSVPRPQGVEDIAEFSKWMAEQFRGIAECLEILHHTFRHTTGSDFDDPRTLGVHGDIKPENILYFETWDGQTHQQRVLQLADFGLAQYHHTVSVKRTRPKGLHAYNPPEVELWRKTDQTVDIWALGCMFLDFSVWLMYGKEGLDEFAQSRRETSIQGPEMKTRFFFSHHVSSWIRRTITISPNPGVVQWIQKIHDNEATPSFIHDIVDLAFLDMLVLYDEAPGHNAVSVQSRPETEGSRPSSMVTKPPPSVSVTPSSKWLEKLCGGPRKERIDSAELLNRIDQLITPGDETQERRPLKQGRRRVRVPRSIDTSVSRTQVQQSSKSMPAQRRHGTVGYVTPERLRTRLAEQRTLQINQDRMRHPNPSGQVESDYGGTTSGRRSISSFV